MQKICTSNWPNLTCRKEPSDRNLPNSFSNAIDIVIRSPKKPLSSAIATEQKRAINVEIRDIPFSLCE